MSAEAGPPTGGHFVAFGIIPLDIAHPHINLFLEIRQCPIAD